MIPHVVRAEEIDPENVQQIDTGTTNNIELRQITTPQQLAAATHAPAAGHPLRTVADAAGCSAVPQPAAAVPDRGNCGRQQAMSNMQQQANPAAPVNLQLTPPQSTAKGGFDFQDDGQSFRRTATFSACR